MKKIELGKFPVFKGKKKKLLTMKLTLIFLIACFMKLSATAYSQNTKFKSDVMNKRIVDVLREIEDISNFRFFYQREQIDVEKKVNINITGKIIEEILPELFAGQEVTFDVRQDNLILIKTQSTESNNSDLLAQQQPREVSGKVTDAAGQPLPGVTVIVKGSTQGTVTNTDGIYTIHNVSENATLVFSFVGRRTQEVEVGNQTSIIVTMEEDVIGLEEVVAIGYGSLRKSDLTGSVSKISISDKEAHANTNLLQALSGAFAGVNVGQIGLTGREPSFEIRGQTSLSASDRPLIVLDGIIYNGDITNININDVESINILKDASAAAVYGSRSANGVMLITTKKGRSDKPIISFNMSYGYQDMTNNPMKVMNAEQYAIRLVDYYYQQSLYAWYNNRPTSDIGKPIRPDITDRQIIAARLRTQEERDNYIAGNEIDWVDEVTRIAPIQNYNLSFSGGSDRSSYFISGSYTNQEGILLNDHFSRFTMHSNLESKIVDWLTIGLISSYSYRDYSGLEASLFNARRASPLANNNIGSPNFDMYLTGEVYMPYPLNNLYVDNSDIENNLFLIGSGKVTVPWVIGLTYELNYSNTYLTRNNNTFYPVITPEGVTNRGQAIKNPLDERNLIVNNIVTYLRTYGDHRVNTTLLYSRENRHAQSSTLNAQGFDNPMLGYNNMSLGTLVSVASSAWEENSLSSMARANYSYKNRYLLTATVRRDGFSGFGANKKFATFPSVSLGWVTSDESFLSDNKWLYLKLRASYGKNGNQGIGRYSSFSRMGIAAYVYGPTTAIGIYPNTLGNADLGWETTSSYNTGIDFGFLNQRISGSVDVYKANTTDVLVTRTLPPTTGYINVWTNIGGIDNKGIGLELTTINFERNVRWETNFVYSINRNKITKLYGDNSDRDIGNSWFVGEPISSIYDYEMEGGLWTEQDLYSGNILNNWYPGQYRYVDQNSDGIIEPNADRTIIGYRTPNYRLSINNTLSYKNFSFSFLINSIQGGNNYYIENNASVVNVAMFTDDVYRINASAVRQYWTPDNGVNNSTGIYNAPPRLSGIYESRSFVRLQDIFLAYNFSPNLLKNLNIDGFQIIISGKNLYTWTKWSGWDPETGTSDSPLMRNINAGIRMTL